MKKKLNNCKNPIVKAFKETLKKNHIPIPYVYVRINQVAGGTSIKLQECKLFENEILSIKRSMARKGFRLIKEDYCPGSSKTRTNSLSGTRFIYR